MPSVHLHDSNCRNKVILDDVIYSLDLPFRLWAVFKLVILSVDQRRTYIPYHIFPTITTKWELGITSCNDTLLKLCHVE